MEGANNALETGDWYLVSANLKVLARLVDGQEMRQALRDSSTRNNDRIHVLDRISQVGDCLCLRLRKFSNIPVNGWSVLLGSKAFESSKRSLCSIDAVLEVPNAFDEGLDTSVRVHVVSHSATPGHVLPRCLVRDYHVGHEQTG